MLWEEPPLSHSFASSATSKEDAASVHSITASRVQLPLFENDVDKVVTQQTLCSVCEQVFSRVASSAFLLEPGHGSYRLAGQES
ncbi:hypothetical protein CDAR_275121 [Caerostris darwini]|uniref:Uncharacterized protein n=1 Tax=Caerostris darwini TaxID=1538125 RepID=A0AAV4STV9_9ARAC|nr:hypothetical protein CDAR_275121 [Caerostris darwini]